MDEILTLARYGRLRDGDRFVGLWVELMVAARQASDGRRIVKSFFRGDVARAVDTAGQQVVADELRDAARLYFASCLTDPQYTSTMFGMKRLPDEEIRGKIANETASALATLAASGTVDGAASALPGALIDGYVDALGPDSEADLRAAAARHPAAARYLQ